MYKNIIGMILVISMIICFFAVDVNAEAQQGTQPFLNTTPIDDQITVTTESVDDVTDTFAINLQNKMEDWIKANYYEGDFVPEYKVFEVLYKHKDNYDNVDWVMIYTDVAFGEEPWTGFALIGKRVFVGGPTDIFRFGMALYDAYQNEFVDLSAVDDYSKYEGLSYAIDVYGKGRLLGDMDSDNIITILDATIIQRCLAEIEEFPDDDIIAPDEMIDSSFHPLQYYSDFNLDGDRTILDATAIQRTLAGF